MVVYEDAPTTPLGPYKRLLKTYRLGEDPGYVRAPLGCKFLKPVHYVVGHFDRGCSAAPDCSAEFCGPLIMIISLASA